MKFIKFRLILNRNSLTIFLNNNKKLYILKKKKKKMNLNLDHGPLRFKVRVHQSLSISSPWSWLDLCWWVHTWTQMGSRWALSLGPVYRGIYSYFFFRKKHLKIDYVSWCLWGYIIFNYLIQELNLHRNTNKILNIIT